MAKIKSNLGKSQFRSNSLKPMNLFMSQEVLDSVQAAIHEDRKAELEKKASNEKEIYQFLKRSQSQNSVEKN